MEKMRKVLFALMLTMIVAALAACGGDTKDGAAGDKPAAEGTETAGEDSADEGADDSTAADGQSAELTDPNFEKIIELLKEEGLDVGEMTAGEADIEGSTEVMHVIIDGEDMLPFQVYKMEPDSENLKSAKEKGEVTYEFEGQSGQIPMDAKGDFLYFLSDGHPDHDKVYDVMENKFEQE